MNCSDYYYATYDFRDDVIGGNPSGFIIDENGGTINIIAEKDNHKKVLEFFDNDVINSVGVINEFPTQIDGVIEFWWSYNATQALQHYLVILFREGEFPRFYLYLNYLYDRLGSIQYRDSIDFHPTGYYDNPINTMIHIKIEFDDTNNKGKFTVNDINYGKFPYFSNSTIGINNILITTRGVNTEPPFWHWIDAIGYSWDFNYNIGDNKFPELNMTDILTPIFSLLFLIFLMILMIFIYMKVRIWLVILVLFLFSLIIGIYSLSLEYIPFNPYFSIFFILFQSVLFIKRSLEVYRL